MFDKEKKVEYIELIYDLIFVYLIGRSNSLLQDVNEGFFSAGTFLTYLLSTLVILEIWYLSSLFINRYGTNSMSDYIGLFINMYLLYYMAGGIQLEWSDSYIRYNMAWGLILINLAIQYLIQLKKRGKNAPWETAHIKSRILPLLIQAAIIFASIPLYSVTHFAFSWTALVVGFMSAFFTRGADALMPVNFEHLTERVMLYTVLSFGEMVVAIAGCFDFRFSLNTIFFSLLAFLIVCGLFLSYGYVYDNIIDRSMHSTGSIYMLLHLVLFLSMSCITTALEYMTETGISVIAKNLLIMVSMIVYFTFLMIICRYARECDRPKKKLVIIMSLVSIVFAALMLLFYRNNYITVAVTAAYVFSVYILIVHTHKKICDFQAAH